MMVPSKRPGKHHARQPNHGTEKVFDGLHRWLSNDVVSLTACLLRHGDAASATYLFEDTEVRQHESICNGTSVSGYVLMGFADRDLEAMLPNRRTVTLQ